MTAPEGQRRASQQSSRVFDPSTQSVIDAIAVLNVKPGPLHTVDEALAQTSSLASSYLTPGSEEVNDEVSEDEDEDEDDVLLNSMDPDGDDGVDNEGDTAGDEGVDAKDLAEEEEEEAVAEGDSDVWKLVGCAGLYTPLDLEVPLSRFSVFFDYPKHIGYNRPRTLVPPVELEPIKDLHPSQRTLQLRFKIGPGCNFNSVISALKRAGLERTKGPHWNICWSKHMSLERMASMRPFQKCNHFPATWSMGRKDRLARNIGKARGRHGSKVYDYLPSSFVLPKDAVLLEIKMREDEGALWIIKPIASSCGKGIRVVSKAKEVDFRASCVVCKYVHNPLLINGKKFDLRLYVLVTCFDPLRIYLYDNGLVRFCTQAYTTDKKSLKQKCTHLTNYSINKKAENFAKNEGGEEDDSSGDKWSTRALRAYFQKNGIDDKAVWADIKDVIVKTVIMAESFVVSAMARGGVSRKACFEVFGFDVLLDDKLKPWLMEVNVGPSVASSSPLDKVIKGSMTTDMFDLLGLPLTDLKQMSSEAKAQQDDKQKRTGEVKRPGSVRVARPGSVRSRTLPTRSKSEKKPALSSYGNGKEDCSRNLNSGKVQGLPPRSSSSARSLFKPEDVELLREVHEEYARSKLGHFRRIFPRGLESDQRLFDLERPKNTVVQRWLSLPAERREAALKAPGIEESQRDGAWWGLRDHSAHVKRTTTANGAVQGPIRNPRVESKQSLHKTISDSGRIIVKEQPSRPRPRTQGSRSSSGPARRSLPAPPRRREEVAPSLTISAPSSGRNRHLNSNSRNFNPYNQPQSHNPSHTTLHPPPLNYSMAVPMVNAQSFLSPSLHNSYDRHH
jgi:tubulin polyglutamylase TTLL4